MNWALGAVVAAPIVKGIGGYFTNKNNAKQARNAATANAAAYLAMGRYNSEAYLTTGRANASNILSVASANAEALVQFADFNASVIELLAEYRAKLNEKDAQQVLEDAEIVVDQKDKEIRQLMSRNRAYYAGAGVNVNYGSPVDVAIDVRTEGDVDIAIIRHGAKVEAARLQDAAAMERWQGSVDSILTRYQGQLQGWQTLTQGQLDAANIMNTAYNASAVTKYESQINAMMTMYNGAQQASAYDSQATQSVFSGFMGAATSYFGYQLMSNKYNTAPPAISTSGYNTYSPSGRLSASFMTTPESKFSLLGD